MLITRISLLYNNNNVHFYNFIPLYVRACTYNINCIVRIVYIYYRLDLFIVWEHDIIYFSMSIGEIHHVVY